MSHNFIISVIVAVSEDLGIGKDNDLIWNIPEDLKRFKKLTMGNTVIMGKKTWESLPRKPLPGRQNIVLTDTPGEHIDSATTAFSIEDALSKCNKGNEVFIIGGGSVYRQFLPLADRLYITHVHMSAPADVFFPEIDLRVWKITSTEEYGVSKTNSIPYSYVIYERIGS